MRFLAILFVCLLAAPALAAQVSLGDLTFNYDPASWRIEAAGGGLVATCVQADCAPAVVDITRLDGEAGCTKEAMSEAAARAFPAAKRSYVNIVRAGRFALILAESHDGPDLSSPQLAYGCVPWQGSDYRFAMRPESVGSQSWIGGALHYLVSQAGAPDARIETVRLGEVDFALSTETWLPPSGQGGDRILLTCRMPTCQEPGRIAALSVHSDGCPSGDDERERRTTVLAPDAPDGLTFHYSETFSGCRNYVPPQIHACAIHNGRTYLLSTFVPSGCQGSIWEIPEQALLDIVKSARVVRPE